ncbi:transcriptional regulator, Spx/MgsR family [Erythrobacter litoralis]|uniref:ArsC family transcriptional regulator n=1 Tax=Erythrobacter litoralis TaxID=39960 RepID=A0A074MVM8_9SPHN|nr:arsenate reductase [Erythrobacter litoralis]AOL22339.1 transcriptional regulator, Spx/MgsR family [Erythrobacter litoralis]KEO89627.1 ArsC family transcriptional regulator [Erythrobacter litoralis]MEE4338124.1 arsenate reductase [Erythrobacter sp.]
MTIHLHGIPNCDTVKKARKWLDAEGLDYTFHDFKKEGADPAKLEQWIAAKGVDTVVNRRGTTFRKLSDEEKVLSQDSHKAVALLVQHPSMIKRPVVEHAGGILIGFKEDEWSQSLS